MNVDTITFFERFESDILSGQKTITIRDESEKDYSVGTVVDVSTFETNRWFCTVKIISVVPIRFDELTQQHAEEENMTLPELKQVIREIYPETNELFVITFELLT